MKTIGVFKKQEPFGEALLYSQGCFDVVDVDES
jgi:hypothetical protein